MRKFLFSGVMKATLPVVLVVTILSGVFSNIRIGLCSNRAEQLGSALAVGSPVLNQNFAVDSWNPYELECFGVYLSNFVEPMTQTYAEAFTDGGSGIYALQMSTKNDPVNNRTLKGLLDVAVGYQFNHTSALYIATYEKLGSDPNNFSVNGEADAKVNATLRSLYNYGAVQSISTDDGIHYLNGEGARQVFEKLDSNLYLPLSLDLCFYKEVEGQKKVMFDTANTYDSDALNALLAYMYNTDGANFSENMWALFDQPLAVDSFGNIVIASSGQMVFPACLNSHSTVDGTINYVNRYMMNTFSRGGSSQLKIDWQTSDVYAAYIRGPVYSDWRNDMGYAGYPVNASKSGSTGMFYAQSADLLNRNVTASLVEIPQYTDSGYVYYVDGFTLSTSARKDRYQSVYDLMKGDFTMGANANGMRFANPLNLSISGGSGDSGWNTTDQGENTNGFNQNKPSLYLMIQLNSVATTSSMCITHSYGGHTPPTQIFNEIYFPSSDDAHCTIFEASSSWRMMSSQLWAAKGANGQVNDEGKIRCECSQAFINGLAHSVYDYTHGDSGQTYSDVGYGPFGGFALKFIGNIQSCIEGEEKYSFATLTECSSIKTTYDIDNYSGYKEDTTLKFTDVDQLKLSGFGDLTNQEEGGNDPDCLMPSQNFYKVYALSETSYVTGIGQFMSNGLGTFEDVASYIYVTYLNYYQIGRENDQYGVKTAKSAFDPMFFDSNILFNDFTAMGISAPDSEQQELAARQRMMMLLDPEKGAEYRRELVTSTLTKFCTDSYNKMTGKQLGVSSGSTLCLQEISENPFTSWLVDHEVWIILIFTFVALVLASWTAITRGKGWFWAVCQIAIGILGVVCIPIMLNCGVGIANFVSGKCYSANADIWWLADAVENRYAEVGLGDLYDADSDIYDEMGLDKETMANIVLSSSTYQSIHFGQDISNKHTMPLSGLYANLSQYPSAAWILPTLLDQTTVEDAKAGGYTLRVGAYKKVSELETMYWGYYPTAIGDTVTMLDVNSAGNYLSSSTGITVAADGDLYDSAGNVWYYRSLGRLIPPSTPLHCSTTFSGYLPAPTSLMTSDVWKSNIDATDKIHNIEVVAKQTGSEYKTYLDSAGKYASNFHAHTLSATNNGYHWYLIGTESPLAYFYAVMQDTFYDFNTAQTIDAMVGTAIEFEDAPGEYHNLNFLQGTVNGTYNINTAVGSLAADHTWQGTAQGTDYARDILDLDYFYRYYAPAMYEASIYSGGSQIGLGEDDATDADVVGAYGSMTVEDAGWDYPIYKDNYASWLVGSNWAIKLYENPQNIKMQTIRNAAGDKQSVCPINPYTYTIRPFVTCRAQMVALGIDEGCLSTVELASVQANDEAMLELVKTVNVYVNAPSTLDVNSFKDLLAVKCLAAYANNINQAALTNAKFKIIPNGFEYSGISYDTVFSQMLYNNYRKANAYTVEDVVEGYIADEGPIMAIFLFVTTVLGAVVIPFVLRIGLAILYCVNIWAALSAIVESLETKASVILAALVNTLSFVLRTAVLFVIQAFMMSLGGAGIIVSKSSIGFKGGATMLIISLMVFYILYTISIVKFFMRTVANGNDMGAAYLKANYEMARDQGLAAYASHKFNQSFAGKMLNRATKGMLANDATASVTGHNAGGTGKPSTGSGTTTSATGSDVATSAAVGGAVGGAAGAALAQDGGNDIDRARSRSNTTLDQAAEKVHANQKDNPSGGSYITESVNRGKTLDTRSEDFMAKAFGDSGSGGSNGSGSSNAGGGSAPKPAATTPTSGGGGSAPKPQAPKPQASSKPAQTSSTKPEPPKTKI